MRKTKLGFELLLIVIFCNGIAHAATLSPISAVPSQTPQTSDALKALPNLKPSTSPDWVSKCVSDSRKSPLECSIEDTLVLATTGQPVASVVVRIQSDTRIPMMAIRVPVGLYLPAGLNLQIDDGKSQAVPLRTCDLQGCYAEMQISADLLAALKGGKRLSIICQNLAEKDIILPLVLDNFADAFQRIQ
jgi:invasion protein IalB